MKKKVLIGAIVMALAMALFLTGCQNNDDPPAADGNVAQETAAPTASPTPPPAGDATPTPEPPPPAFEGIHPGLEALDELLTQFPMTLVNNNPILQRGDPGNTLRLVVGSGGTFPGLFEGTMSSEAFDSQIMDFQRSPLVFSDQFFMWADGGIADLSFDHANNAVELNMNHEVFWHDGVPLTLDDLVFAYELIAHPDETAGVRYVEAHYIPWIVGMDAYRDGTADHISGLVLSNNNRTLRIYYDRPLPPAAQYLGGIWITPTPRHHLEPAIAEVGIENLSSHARARHEALGWGPFIIESIVPGENVLFRANDNYYRGRPNIDYILWQILPLEIYMAAMREGEYDITINGMPAVDYAEHLLFNPNNYTLLGQVATGSGYMYYRTGTMIDNWATPRPEGWHPIQDVNIRRALSHAMPQPLIAATVQNGLSVPAGTIMSPFNARGFIAPDIPMLYYSVERANQILDEAGYTQRGPDGFRLDLNGDPMFFNFAANDNAFNREAVPTYLQSWRDVGLDVRLHTGDVIEWNTFLTNLLLSDNWSDEVHMFISNWSLGANPAPHSLWSPEADFNMPRHNTEEYRGILDDIASQEAFDFDFLADAYHRWQMYMYDNAVAQHMWWGIGLTAVNHRVANFSLERSVGANGAMQSMHLWGLTAPQAYANTN